MIRRIIAVLTLTALTVGTVVAPALAQPRQNGLVNVNIEDTTIQAPIAVAANLCDVNVAVLVAQLRDTGEATCTATAESVATNGPNGGGNNANQNGLVNVNIDDLTVQAPISLAANLCDVNAGVLVGQLRDTGSAECTATAESIATNGRGGNG